MSTPKTFTIRTFADIFQLPTTDQIENCLDELKRGMIQARLAQEVILDVLKFQTRERPEGAFEWHETFKWTDDGKGEVRTNFRAEEELFSMVTRPTASAPASPHPAP